MSYSIIDGLVMIIISHNNNNNNIRPTNVINYLEKCSLVKHRKRRI